MRPHQSPIILALLSRTFMPLMVLEPSPTPAFIFPCLPSPVGTLLLGLIYRPLSVFIHALEKPLEEFWKCWIGLGPVWMQRFRSVPPYKSTFSFRFKTEESQFSQQKRSPNGTVPFLPNRPLVNMWLESPYASCP